MTQKQEVIDQICEAFATTPYPGDRFLLGTVEGTEPHEEVGVFVGKSDWRELDSTMLDRHYSALSFFSECGFRFFLPAYLIADLCEELLTADPLFHLWHGFATVSAEIPVGKQMFRRDSGGKRLLNPRRFGAMTWTDYARYRLSVFTREEAKAIVAYMTYKRDRDTMGLHKPRIDAALQDFWLDRLENAPTHDVLRAHAQEEEQFTAAVHRTREEKQ